VKSSWATSLRMPLAVLVLTLASVGCARSPQASGPNVLVLVLDALRADHLGLYGYSRDTSPRLDEYARRGVAFDRAYSQASATLPSVCTMFTSLYPTDHSVSEGGPFVLGQDFTTLAEILNNAGYRTGFFSANSLFGYNVSGNDKPWSLGFEQGFDEFFVATGSDSGYLRAEPLNEQAVKWITQRGSPEPFFAYIHYMDPHIPYDPPTEYRELFPDPYEGEIEWGKKMLELWASGESIPEEARQHVISLYDAEIAYADHCIAEMLDSLDAAGVLSDTLVVLTADHGEAFHEHDGIWVHGLGLYEELIRVPLVVVPPNAEVGTEQARISSVVGLIDLMPTILDYAKVTGKRRPFTMRGLSLATLLQDTSAVIQRNGVAAELKYALRPEGDPQAFTSRALVTERLKLIEINRPGEPARTLLFDLEQDPLEQRSLSDDASSSEHVELLSAQLDIILGGQDQAPGRPLPKRVRDRLRAVGYL